MNITINNQQKEVSSETIAQLVSEMQLPDKGVAIAVNNKVVPRTTWNEYKLAENDSVTIIKAAFGG